MFEERSEHEILSDIFDVLMEKDGKSKKTRLMNRACLDWKNFKRYFEFLSDEGYIEPLEEDPDIYAITEKGRELNKRLKGVMEVLYDKGGEKKVNGSNYKHREPSSNSMC